MVVEAVMVEMVDLVVRVVQVVQAASHQVLSKTWIYQVVLFKQVQVVQVVKVYMDVGGLGGKGYGKERGGEGRGRA